VGLPKDTKAMTAAQHAARAAPEGRTVLLHRYNILASAGSLSGPIPRAAEVMKRGYTF
jgi:hypothetical protein